MLRRAALPLAIVTAISLCAIPAEAGPGIPVSIQNLAFTPNTLTVTIGATVHWTNNDPGITHTVTSDKGFFDSGDLSTGDDFAPTAPFKNAGAYPYHCMHHSTMHGTVNVRMTKSGSPASGFTVIWSSAAGTPANRNFDVQIKRPGHPSFESFRSATRALKAFFHPARTGIYKFKSRTRNTSTGQVSGYSPVLTLTIS